jgi:hypothetical protein
MPVPETPMNQYHFSPPWKNKVGLPWKPRTMQPESVTERVDQLSNGTFWAGVATENASQSFAVGWSRRPPVVAGLTG